MEHQRLCIKGCDKKQNLSVQLHPVLKTESHHNAHVIFLWNIKMTNGCIKRNTEFQHQNVTKSLQNPNNK